MCNNRWFVLLVLNLLLLGCGGSSSTDSAAVNDDNNSSDGSTLEWPIEDGRFASPTETLIIGGPSHGEGVYYIDIQGSFPDVDWNTLERLYIAAGQYAFIRIGNLPERTADNPLVITNYGGQVRIGGLDHYYLAVLSGGANWVLTGRYDPDSGTGDINYPGHRGGAFANSQGTYGILIDDDFVRDGNSGLDISAATDFEVEYLEVREVDFAGMTMKTDDDGDQLMENVLIHDNYIHDTGSEGLYIGSTQSQPQHKITSWEFYNNRVLRTGTEAIQLGQLAGETKVHNNVFGPAAIDWRAAFQVYQDNNFQIGLREGHLQVYNNIFIGAAGSMISFFAKDIDGDSVNENVGATFTDNYFVGFRSLAGFIDPTYLENMTYRFENNQFGGYRFDRDEVYLSAYEYGTLFRTFNSDTPIEFVTTQWVGPESLSNSIDNNGEYGNFSGVDNTNIESLSLSFVDSGLSDDFNYLDIEMWTETATLGDDQAVEYSEGDIAMYLGIAYQCSVSLCESGASPVDNPVMWTELSLPDDVRIVPGSSWSHLGLMPL